MTGKTPQKPVMPVHPVVVPFQPVADALDEDTICRKTGTIVGELAQNKDFKVKISPITVYQVNEILKKMSGLISVTLPS